MSFFRRALERRAAITLKNPSDSLRLLFGGATSYAGKTVSVQDSLGLAPFYRGVQLLSGSVGMLPCKVYRDVSKQQGEMSARSFKRWLAEECEQKRAQAAQPGDLARGRVEAGPLSRPRQLLHDKPNPEQTPIEFWSLTTSHLVTWGNGFAWKDRNSDGTITALWPFHPSRMQVGRLESGERFFVVDGDTSNPATDFDFIHFRGLGDDGLLGYSPVSLYRQGLGSALARQEFEGRFWSEDATPGGGVALIHPKSLKPDAIQVIKDRWKDAHKGLKRDVAVLGEDMKVQQMTVPLRDAQYIEGKRMDATEQALVLGIPPYMVAGDTGGSSLTYSTVEGQAVDFLKWTLSPWLVRMQQTITVDPDVMPSNHFAEFETGAVLRATTKERYEAWSIAPHLTIDEMREMDNRLPLPNGEGEGLSKSVPVEKTPPAITVGDDPKTKEGDNGDS